MNNTACFVATISKDKIPKLEEDLRAQGFEMTTPPNTIFKAQKTGLSCTLYSSGKLTVQGKNKHEFLLYYLEPEILQTLSYSNPSLYVDTRSRIGIDEAGKGDFFGPLCIAGVQVEANQIEKLLALGVKDSKKLSDPTILTIAKKVRSEFPYSVVRISPLRYNEMYASFGNLNALLGWGHATAIEELFNKTGCTLAVVDQFASESIVQRALEKKKIQLQLEQRHRAEEDPVVAAASILARAAFVEAIAKMSEEYEVEIPKGASELVKQVARKLIARFGPSILSQISKTHFKTAEEVLRD